MEPRDIHCCACSIYVGTLRDARLMKGLSFLCPSCRGEYIGSDGPSGVSASKRSRDDYRTVDYLMNMFGMGGRKR